MKLVLSLAAVCAMSFAFTSCGNTGGGTSGPDGMGQQMGIGPFDSRGNYVEELADSPSKWRRPGNSSSSSRPAKTESVSEVAQNDQPPMNSVPLVSKTSAPVPTISETKVVRTSSSRSKSDEEPVVIRTRKIKPDPEPEPEKEVAKTKSKTKSKESSTAKETATKSKVSSTKSKEVAKTKTKPKSSRYTVKSGDSLSSIASRNGTSVAALKSENGISGTMIRPGQSLTIPKK